MIKLEEISYLMMYHCNGALKDVVFDHWDKTSVMQRRNVMTFFRIWIHVANQCLLLMVGTFSSALL